MGTRARATIGRYAGRLLLLGGLLAVGGVRPSAAQDAAALARLVRERVALLDASLEVAAAGDRLVVGEVLARFYAARDFAPAWVQGRGTARLDELEAAIRLAGQHGLDPADYHLGALQTLRRGLSEATPSEQELVDLELLASDAFVLLGTHLLRGRANPATVDPEWLVHRRSAALDSVLAVAVDRGRIAATLYGLAPRDPRYARLVAAAVPLREAAARGGWPVVPAGPRLELGVQDPRVETLRARLVSSEDLNPGATGGDAFDERLDLAVRRFQARHGLEVDGVVGRATIAELNVPAQERIVQLEVNLERWRWLPADLGERHIEVNVPAFDLRVVEHGSTVYRHRVIVGIEDRQTPMVSGMMTHVVLSPYWTVPASIAGRDLLPAIRRNPDMLEAQHFALFDRGTGEPVDPLTVDWPAMTDSAAFNARYRLRQDPGPFNALGTVKFVFSNGHAIYLHDTPATNLFERPQRDFSSGCIRVENALDLAGYVLADQPEWTRDRIEAAIASGVEVAVPLTREIPVHLLYWTAWVDEDGTLQFRDDLYGRDETVRRALLQPPRCS